MWLVTFFCHFTIYFWYAFSRFPPTLFNRRSTRLMQMCVGVCATLCVSNEYEGTLYVCAQQIFIQFNLALSIFNAQVPNVSVCICVRFGGQQRGTTQSLSYALHTIRRSYLAFSAIEVYAALLCSGNIFFFCLSTGVVALVVSCSRYSFIFVTHHKS